MFNFNYSKRGITYISKDLNVRLKHFIDALKKSDYDVVALQEVRLLEYYTVLCIFHLILKKGVELERL
jgi:hypothetical protein